MPSSATLRLDGAPDALIGTPEAKVKAVQVMQLDMNNDILEDLLDSVRRGKQPQIVFGRSPMLRYDGKSHSLHSSQEKFRNELYRSDGGAENEWAFAGLVNHTLRAERMQEASTGVDKALETLKSQMRSIEEEREARKLTISTPEMRASKGGNLSKAKARAGHLKPLPATSTKSLPPSPALAASSPHLAPPLSAGLDATLPGDIALKKALTHFLAVKARSGVECRRAVGSAVSKWMDRVAKKTGEDEWTLLDRVYKDLDVWNFKYPGREDRQAAVDNAIRAYDRMRLSKDDDLWQKLLPVEERGQGKILSRLNLQKGPLVRTPAVKPNMIDRKTGLPKRAEAKRADKESTAKAKRKESGEESIKVAKGVKNTSRTPKPNTPRPDTGKERKAARKEPHSTSTTRREDKSSTSTKIPLNKPKNPSPLSASPPINATDFESDHPVHKALSSAVSPKRLTQTKRKPEDHHRPSANGTLKRKAVEMHDAEPSGTPTSQKQRKVNGNATAKGHRSPEQASDNSSGSPPLALSWRQSLDRAKKFKVYYERYAKLYMELSTAAEPPTQTQREQLMSMHRSLEEMKREVRSGAL